MSYTVDDFRRDLLKSGLTPSQAEDVIRQSSMARATASALNRAREITALCRVTNLTGKTAEMILSGKTFAQVQAALRPLLDSASGSAIWERRRLRQAAGR